MDIRRGQVWWWKCEDTDRAHIQRGSRPVIIVSNDVCNKASGVVTVVPCTTRVKKPFPQQVPVIFNESVSIALADQITSIPINELEELICKLHDYQMNQVDTAIAIQLGFVKVDSKSYSPFHSGVKVDEDGTC